MSRTAQTYDEKAIAGLDLETLMASVASKIKERVKMVDVSEYTSAASIEAVATEGSLPYYAYDTGSVIVKIPYVGKTSSQGGASLNFCAIVNNTLYRTYFNYGSDAFGAVSSNAIITDARLRTSSDQNAWGMDDTNVPTRAAVENKIDAALSGTIGGFLGPTTVSSMNYNVNFLGYNFKKGDWFSMMDGGTLYYYPGNDRTQQQQTITVNAGDDVYWTTSGNLVYRTSSNNVRRYQIMDLSDWNTLTETGIYEIGSQVNSVADNSPPSEYGRMTLYVTKDVNTNTGIYFVTQMAVGDHVSIRYQEYSGGSYVWGSWKRLNYFSAVIDDTGATRTATSFADLKAAAKATKDIVLLVKTMTGLAVVSTVYTLAKVNEIDGEATSFEFMRVDNGSGTPSKVYVWTITNSTGWTFSERAWDSVPTDNSANLVTSGGVKSYVDSKYDVALGTMNRFAYMFAPASTNPQEVRTYHVYGQNRNEIANGTVSNTPDAIRTCCNLFADKIHVIYKESGTVAFPQRYSGDEAQTFPDGGRYILTVQNTSSGSLAVRVQIGGISTIMPGNYADCWYVENDGTTDSFIGELEGQVFHYVELGNVPAHGVKSWEIIVPPHFTTTSSSYTYKNIAYMLIATIK